MLSVPRSDRVPPLILRLMTRCRRLRSAALLSEGTAGSATKTKSSPHPVRGGLLMWRSIRRHSLAWVADGSCRQGWQRASSCRSRASWAVRRFDLEMSAGLGPVVNPVDDVGLPGQWRSIGVDGALVVDVPQQVRPAPLLRAVILVVGGVEIADQYSGERIAQRLVHDCFAPTPPQEVAFAGSSVRWGC